MALLLLFLALAVSVFSQSEKQADTVKPSASPTLAAQENKVTVYFYRYKQYVGSALEPPVFCDDKMIAKMDNGRYFRAVVDPGKHTFQSNDKQSGVELDLKNGEEYYIRIEIAAGFWKGHGRLVVVQKEQGAFEIKKLKPLQAKKIIDSSKAFTEDEPKP